MILILKIYFIFILNISIGNCKFTVTPKLYFAKSVITYRMSS